MKRNKKIIIGLVIVILLAIIVTLFFLLKNNEKVQRYGRTEVYVKDDTGNIIAGALIGFNNKETGEVIDPEAESGLDGKIVYTNVPVGEYEVVPKEAPKGYELNQNSVDVTINPAETTITNVEFKRIRGTFVIKVQDQNGNIIPNTKLTIYNDENEAIQNITTDEEGYCGVRDLPLGTYVAEVTELPDGYTCDTTKYEIKLEQDDQVLLVEINANKN